MIKLSVNETKWSSLLARTRALILYISIWIFDFGPVKLPGPSRNGPQSGWLRRFGSLHPNPHSWIFTSLTVYSSSLSYLFTSATVRIPGHTTSNCGTEAIRYVTLQFSRSAARSLCDSNRTEITVLTCEQRPYQACAGGIAGYTV